MFPTFSSIGSSNGHYGFEHGQPNVEVEDDEEYEDYVDYQPLHIRKDKDNHNKCCNNHVWCVRVSYTK